MFTLLLSVFVLLGAPGGSMEEKSNNADASVFTEEYLLHGEYTAGASDDLSRASEIARAMVDRFGMSERGLSVRQGASDASDDTVETLIQQAAMQARMLIAENSAFLEAVATGLLESNELSREDIERLGALHACHATLEVGSTS